MILIKTLRECAENHCQRESLTCFISPLCHLCLRPFVCSQPANHLNCSLCVSVCVNFRKSHVLLVTCCHTVRLHLHVPNSHTDPVTQWRQQQCSLWPLGGHGGFVQEHVGRRMHVMISHQHSLLSEQVKCDRTCGADDMSSVFIRLLVIDFIKTRTHTKKVTVKTCDCRHDHK